jgi:hypothetical protein
MTYFNVHELKRNLVLTHALGNGVSKPHELLVSLSLRRFRVLTQKIGKTTSVEQKDTSMKKTFLLVGFFGENLHFNIKAKPER